MGIWFGAKEIVVCVRREVACKDCLASKKGGRKS